MKASLVACGVLAAVTLHVAPAAASEPLFALEDPTPNQFFSGSYLEHGQHHDGKESGKAGYQDGYLAIYEDGLVACNGNGDYHVFDQDGDGDDDALQGYVWVGSDHAAQGDYVTVAGAEAYAPGGVAGAGSDHGKFSGRATGDPPCEEADPEGDGAGR